MSSRTSARDTELWHELRTEMSQATVCEEPWTIEVTARLLVLLAELEKRAGERAEKRAQRAKRLAEKTGTAPRRW